MPAIRRIKPETISDVRIPGKEKDPGGLTAALIIRRQIARMHRPGLPIMNESMWLRTGERFDDLQRNGLKLIQNEKMFCFGMDAVLLSAFTEVREGENVLDLGTGTGVIPILLSARTPGKHFTGLEINAYSADMASRSVRYNHIEEKVSIVQGDLRKAAQLFPTGSFNVVTSNPPYMPAGHGLTSPNMDKAAARHELLCTLEDVVSAAGAMLPSQGRFCMVHRPFRLPEILNVMSAHHLEPKRMRLVYPTIESEPAMVLLEGLKGGRPRMKVEKPLIIYESPGIYSQEVRALYES